LIDLSRACLDFVCGAAASGAKRTFDGLAIPRSAKTDLAAAYEKGERDPGHEDPKKKSRTMSAGHCLTMLAGAGTTYDPHQKERELVQVTVTRRRLSGNQSRWYRFPWGLPGRARL
jgi:hypothetical protein